MPIVFKKLTIPTLEIATTMNNWANDRQIVHLMRPSFSLEELEAETVVSVKHLEERLDRGYMIYLIYADKQLVGEVNYIVDPPYLMKQESGSAWIGISIGVASARGKGIGAQAMQHLEGEIRTAGLARIELGVFEYNERAIKLYKKMGYQEIGRVEEFTYWDGKMWTDIRMEKRLK